PCGAMAGQALLTAERARRGTPFHEVGKGRAPAAGELIHAECCPCAYCRPPWSGPYTTAVAAAVDQVVPPRALAAWLGSQGLTDGTGVGVEQLSGGASNLTFRVRTGDRDWVLRRPPAKGALPTAHDVLREHRIQAALAPTPVPVPRMVAMCADESVIGAPFYVMERVEGEVYASAAAIAALAPADARAASQALVTTLATLHAV